MKRTWKEKFTANMRRQIKRHKHLKPLIVAWMVIVTCLYDIAFYFANNTKRFASVLAVAVFFITSSSFSFLTEEEKLASSMEAAEWDDIQESYEYTPTTFNIEEIEILDDDDVLEGYDNDELEVDASDIDQYSLDDILEANEVTTGTGVSSEETANLSKDDWQLVLVNKQHPVPDDYTFTLGTIKGSMKCDERIIDDLMDMMQEAKADGVNLVICSPYRDYNRQTVLFNRKIDCYMEQGYSYLEAYKIASMTVTVPGASEHQIGLALDIVSTTYSSLDVDFGETEAGIWLREHCAEYGFILRYPLGKEYITGIQYEPWHFRYVGKQAAQIIMENDLTLEEFLDTLD